MTWAGQEKAGGYRESEQIVPTEPKGNRELNDSLGNIPHQTSVPEIISMHIIE